MSQYLLPFHTDLHVEDRLGILDPRDDSSGLVVSQGALLLKLLENTLNTITRFPESTVKAFIDLLETIAYTIHENGNLDTRTLQTFLSKRKDRDTKAIPNIVRLALRLKSAFASQSLTQLTRKTFHIARFPESSANTLLAHAALGTFRRPDGNTWGVPGCLSWYAGAPNHPKAVEGYLEMLFAYFEKVELEKHPAEAEYLFELSQPNLMCDPSGSCQMPQLKINTVEEIHEPVVPGDDKDTLQYILVAANKQPGPGPTGTQEERIQAMSPVLILCSLICPVIPDDAAVLAFGLPVLGEWKGHNRTAELIRVFEKPERPLKNYILADALPLDEISTDQDGKLPDLLTGRTYREIFKLFAAFWGAVGQKEQQLAHPMRCHDIIIDASAWGCGAFGGNLVVKAMCMMIAAGMSSSFTFVLLRLNLVKGQHDSAAAILEKWIPWQLEVYNIWNHLQCMENGTEKDLMRVLALIEEEELEKCQVYGF